MGRAYEPGHGRGYRYDDPAFGIEWPEKVRVIGEADLEWGVFVRPRSTKSSLTDASTHLELPQ
jgi:hypothetical protein